MSTYDTDPDGLPPFSEPEDILAAVVRRELAPLLCALDQLRADLGLANGQTRSVLHRVTDLEDRVAALEEES